MQALGLLLIIILLGIIAACFFYLLSCLKKNRQITALAGLFSLAMGFFLLALDLVLITFTQGMQYIPDYLLFNRLVSDTGFAGRWVLTVYVFISAGLGITIYLLARNLITQFNSRNIR
ncbi:MAG: hypothetical protein JRF05_02290 [Deltaproteobacteria bacterium]|jgi:hypothetical protein|nr:hypothetical protein [Deltaproteobacteria bacterium]